MFFLSSKFIWFLVAPSSIMIWLIIAIIGLFIIKKDRIAKRLLYVWVTVFLIVGCTSIVDRLFNSWERQYPLISVGDNDYEGVIILGGAIDITEVASQKRAVLNNFNHARIVQMLSLIQKHPEMKFIYTGGNALIFNKTTEQSEAEIAENILIDQFGISTSNIFFEGESKNTYQNALYSRQLYADQVSKNWPSKRPWLLLTSAYHMPRSMEVFKKAGWNVTAYPASYTDSTISIWDVTTKFWDNWFKIDVLARELLGMIAYRLTNKI